MQTETQRNQHQFSSIMKYFPLIQTRQKNKATYFAFIISGIVAHFMSVLL